jgi:hypothetical protein
MYCLQGILSGMERNKHDKHVQISGSASLFYIVKGCKKEKLTHTQKRYFLSLRGIILHYPKKDQKLNFHKFFAKMNYLHAFFKETLLF